MYKYKLNGKIIVTKGRLKGETGVAIGERVDANYCGMIWIRRDNPKARDACVQIPLRWIKENKG